MTSRHPRGIFFDFLFKTTKLARMDKKSKNRSSRVFHRLFLHRLFETLTPQGFCTVSTGFSTDFFAAAAVFPQKVWKNLLLTFYNFVIFDCLFEQIKLLMRGQSCTSWSNKRSFQSLGSLRRTEFEWLFCLTFPKMFFARLRHWLSCAFCVK